MLKDGSGKLLTGRAVVWTSSDSTMARVSPTGLVTALAPGYINVLATSEGRSGTGTVMVTKTAAAVASVELAPATISIPLGDTAALTASPKDDQGNTLGGHAMTWTSNDQRVASVSTTGTVTGLRLGTALVTVIVEGKRDTARVTVTPPPVAIVIYLPSRAPPGRRTAAAPRPSA